MSLRGTEILFIFPECSALIAPLSVLPSVTAEPSLLCRRALVSSGPGNYLKISTKKINDEPEEEAVKQHLMEEDGEKREEEAVCVCVCANQKELDTEKETSAF